MNKDKQESINDSKEIEFYSNSVNAWFNTKLERDKSILVISAGALGLLITLLTAFGVNNKMELLIFFAAIFCFMIAIIIMIVVFNRNASYLEKLNQGNDSNDSLLFLLDKIGFLSFIFGIIFTFLIGCYLLVSSLNKNMEEKEILKLKIKELKLRIKLEKIKNKQSERNFEIINPNLLTNKGKYFLKK